MLTYLYKKKLYIFLSSDLRMQQTFCACVFACYLIVNIVNNLQCVAVAKLGNVLRSIHFSWLINFRIAQN